MEDHKDVLGICVGQNESAKFWLSILNGLRNRGVEEYPDHMRGWADRIFSGNRGCSSTDRNSVVYYPLDPELNEVYFLQRN